MAGENILGDMRKKWSGRESKNVHDISGKLTEDERRAAGLASFLDQVALGYGTPALAGLMSLLPGRGTYEQENFLAENLQRRLQVQDPNTNLAARGAAFLGPSGPLRLAAMAKNTAAGSVGAGTAALLAMLQQNAPEEWVPVERTSWRHRGYEPEVPFSQPLDTERQFVPGGRAVSR